MVFVNCLVENPDFDSQSKDYLTSVRTVSLMSCKIPKSFLAMVIDKLGIIDDIIYDNKMRERRKLLRATTTKTKSSVSSIAPMIKLDGTSVITPLPHSQNRRNINPIHTLHLTDCRRTQAARCALCWNFEVIGVHTSTYRRGLGYGAGCGRIRSSW
jgi:DNA gyrase B